MLARQRQLLYLHHGEWDGRQVLPEQWVQTSLSSHVENYNDGGAYRVDFG